MMYLVPIALLIATLSSISYAVSSSYPNAFALIEAQSDLKIISTLIKRDSELVNLYQSVKDVTIFTAVDDSFPPQDRDLNAPPFTNKTFIRAVLNQIIIEGVHPTSSFTHQPKYYKSKLTDPDYVNLSSGAAVARLVKLNNKNTFLAGSGVSANVIESGAVSQTHSHIIFTDFGIKLLMFNRTCPSRVVSSKSLTTRLTPLNLFP